MARYSRLAAFVVGLLLIVLATWLCWMNHGRSPADASAPSLYPRQPPHGGSSHDPPRRVERPYSAQPLVPRTPQHDVPPDEPPSDADIVEVVASCRMVYCQIGAAVPDSTSVIVRFDAVSYTHLTLPTSD